MLKSDSHSTTQSQLTSNNAQEGLIQTDAQALVADLGVCLKRLTGDDLAKWNFLSCVLIQDLTHMYTDPSMYLEEFEEMSVHIYQVTGELLSIIYDQPFMLTPEQSKALIEVQNELNGTSDLLNTCGDFLYKIVWEGLKHG